MSRYSWGADEFLFVELAEEMSLQANVRAMAIATVLRERRPDGLIDICPANASYQLRFDPDRLPPAELEALARAVEEEVGDAHGFELETRIVEIPVLYDDPWTHETLMRFRDRHQEPDSTDLEYAARINGFSGKDEFIAAHHGAPWFASMVGFVAGLPFLYQMVPRERQLEVPKYVRPRTDTPALTIGHGGCFGCIYSVRGAGGYQMFGITPLEIYEPRARRGVLHGGRHRALHADHARRVRRAAGVAAPAALGAGELQPRGLRGGPRGLQRAAAGGARMIEVSKPGLSTTVQDAGRDGYYDVGIPPSGALDQFSLVAANRLVGNDEGAAALEIAYLGPELRFTEAATVAVTGAELVPRVNGEERPVWEAFSVPADGVLSFAHLRGGARAYLAVAGAIDVPELLGSRSTYALGSLGGFSGRALASGDVLAVGAPRDAVACCGAGGPAAGVLDRARDPCRDGSLRPSAD